MPTTYTADRDKRLLSHEMRLSRSSASGESWVVGLSLIDDKDILSRTFGSAGMPATIIGVTNVTKAASAFAEATAAISTALSFTLGARATIARVDGEPSSQPRPGNFVKGRVTRRIDPTIAASWQVRPRVALFARFQTGYRTGGLAVAPGIGRVSDFRPDTIRVGEVGLRQVRSGKTGLAFSGSLSATRWHAIQADLISRRGSPYTSNIGDARIKAVEGNIDWVPFAGLNAEAAFLWTANRVSGPVADLSVRRNRRLPETPAFASHGALRYEWRRGSLAPALGLTVDTVGRSVLGTGDLLDIPQGRFVTVGMTAAITVRALRFSLTADNLGNVAANRFAYGNPFTLAARDQTTPLRPRNVRFGVRANW